MPTYYLYCLHIVKHSLLSPLIETNCVLLAYAENALPINVLQKEKKKETVCMCVHVCAHVLHVCVHAYMHVHMCVRVYMCMCACVYKHRVRFLQKLDILNSQIFHQKSSFLMESH